MLYLLFNNTYAETDMEDLRIKHHMDASSGRGFLYLVKKLFSIRNNQQQLDYFEGTHIKMEIWKRATAIQG
jgi:hypothetical protein